MLAMTALAGAWPVAAQSVRCEGADRRVTYSNTECPPGTRAVRSVPAAPAPTAAETRAARERARQDAARVHKLEREQFAADQDASRRQAAADKRSQQRDAVCRKLEQRMGQAERDLQQATLKNRSAAERKFNAARDQHERNCAGD